jgi:acyl-CoA synthetase (NDP forming)/GNAT superfamily N-acetyltransferase
MPTRAADIDLDALLLDGRIARIRTVQASDAGALQAMHDGVSSDALYLRFFSLSRSVVPEEIHALTRPAGDDHLSLLAEIGGRVVGVATFERLDNDRTKAEIAFLVDDTHRGRGIGMLLLEHLAGAAVTVGVRSFVAETLASNSSMLHVFSDTGLPMVSRYDDGVVHIEIALEFDDEFRSAVDRREAHAEAISMKRVLAPASVAVVGAGSDPAGLGHQILANIVRGGYRGQLYAVNQSAHRVSGVRAFTSLEDLPAAVDLVVVAVPAAAVLEIAREAADHGAAGLVVISAGFGESGPNGDRLQRDLVRICRESGMRLIGPNCIGVANADPFISLNATTSTTMPPAGGIGLMSQSGGVGFAALQYAARSGVGISNFVSAGNKADVSGNDLLCAWEHDEETRVCALYLESFGNPRKFARVAARVSRRKPVVAVKAGRLVAGVSGVRSLTAGAATPDIAVDSLFEQAGVTRVDSLAELFDVASLFDLAPLPHGPRVAIVSNSGGPGLLAADACDAAGLDVVALSEVTRRRLGALVPTGTTIGNPVDLLSSADPVSFEAALRVLLDDPEIDAVISVYTPLQVGSANGIARAIATVQADVPGKPLLVCFLGVETMPSELRAAGGRPVAPYYAFPESAAHALGAAARYVAWRERPWGNPPVLADLDVAAARAIVTDALAALPDGCWLDAQTAAALLATHGVHVVQTATHEAQTTQTAMAIGVVSDPTFGPLVMVGLGGLASELLADRAFRLLPLTVEDARRQIRSLRGAPLLFGYRDVAPCNVVALEDMLLRVAELATNIPELAELDLNPVLVSAAGAEATDVRVCLRPATAEDPLIRRLR